MNNCQEQICVHFAFVCVCVCHQPLAHFFPFPFPFCSLWSLPACLPFNHQSSIIVLDVSKIRWMEWNGMNCHLRRVPILLPEPASIHPFHPSAVVAVLPFHLIHAGQATPAACVHWWFLFLCVFACFFVGFIFCFCYFRFLLLMIFPLFSTFGMEKVANE